MRLFETGDEVRLGETDCEVGLGRTVRLTGWLR